MEIVDIFPLLIGEVILLGCIWWELRIIRKMLVEGRDDGAAEIKEGPPHNVSRESSGFHPHSNPDSDTAIVATRNPQVRAAQYRRTHVEKLRKEEKDAERQP